MVFPSNLTSRGRQCPRLKDLLYARLKMRRTDRLGNHPLPTALDPFTCNRAQNSHVKSSTSACATSASAAEQAHTIFARSRRRSAALRPRQSLFTRIYPSGNPLGVFIMPIEKEKANLTQAVGIRELYTDETVVALNAALFERGVEIEQIISVLTVPGQAMGRPVPPRFRVLYRSN